VRADGVDVSVRIERATEGAVPVGTTALNVDQAVNSAEFTLVIAPEHRGRGYATEATALTLDWAFSIASLSAVWLEVLDPHTAAELDLDHIWQLVDELIEAHGNWLPAYS